MKQTIRQLVFAVALQALAAYGLLSAAAADEITMAQTADSSAQQQSQDDELIQAIDIWQLVDQDSPQETMLPADVEPAQETVFIEPELPAEEKTTPQAESASAVTEQRQTAPSADISSGQQNNAEPVQEAVIMEAQAPAKEQQPEKAAASEPGQPQPASPAAVPNGRQDNGTPAQAQNRTLPPSWPDQELVVIEAPAAAVPNGPQNGAQPQFRQESGWPVPEPPQSLPLSAPEAAPAMPSASAGQAVRQLQPGSTVFPAPVLAAPAAQDDIVAAVEEALRQYRSKDFAGAVSNLDYAAHLIRQKKTELLKELLPEPFYGWQAKEAVSQSLGTAVFGGGSTVSRDYFTQNGSVISIEVVSDSPVLQSIIMMLNNPLFAGASGGNLKTIKRQRAMIKYNEEEHRGEINIVVASRFIVTVKGRGVDLTWLLRYAEAMDFDALAKN